MTFQKYTPANRQWDHVGNLVPNFEHSEGIRPAMYGYPAPWLPVQIEDKWYEVWITVAAGRPVALTLDGFLAPAGLKTAWADAAGGDTILTYTADDVAEKVMDLTTGAVVASATSYTKTQVQTALRSLGLIDNTATPDAFISYTIGLAAQSYYTWASYVDKGEAAWQIDTFTPAEFKFHNFRMQHQVPVLCDYVIRVPWLASASTDETIDGAITDGTPTFGDANLYTSTKTKLLKRYSDISSDDFVAWFSAYDPIAKNTSRTELSADDASLLVRERTSPEDLSQAGDYYVDYQRGVWFFYASGGATAPTYVTGTTLSFYEYSTAPSTVGDYVSVTGDIKPGSFVKIDGDSNFTVTTSGDITTIMGQVLGFITHPKDKLDRVKTWYSDLGTVNKMPGTATSGYPDTLNNTSTGADTEVIINLISR